MGKLAKRTYKNRVRIMDKRKKETGEIPKDAKELTNRAVNNARRFIKSAMKEADKQEKAISMIANSCILCYSMAVMRDKWKFSAANLRKFYRKWVSTYDAITYKDGAKPTELLATVKGVDFDDGDVGYKKYQVRVFDADNSEFDKMSGPSTREKLQEYYVRKKMVGFMNSAELVTIMVLFDYFDFKATKLAHYIDHVRKFYDMSFSAARKILDQLEQKCNIQLDRMSILKDAAL